MLGFALCYLLYFGRERSLVLVNSVLLLAMGICLVGVPLNSIILKMGVQESAGEMPPIVFSVFYIVMPLLLWMAVILFSPLKELTRRLAFVVLGVLILIGLSEISKLNLHQYLQAPKVSESNVAPSLLLALEGSRLWSVHEISGYQTFDSLSGFSSLNA
jgi:hypothetical protein